jgi:hypothetical protein
MPNYRFTSENDEYTEVVADARFDDQLASSEMLEILEAIRTTIHLGSRATIFLEGLKSVSISETNISLELRFNRKGILSLAPQDRDAFPGRIVRFLMYCFATIDKIHSLSETPFPHNFRSFIDISSWS